MTRITQIEPMPKREPTYDKRLLGTWKSDRRKTFERYQPKKNVPAAAFRKFRALFGKMTIQWTRRKVLSSFGDTPLDPMPYLIVGRDDTSVVVRVECELSRLLGESLTHIHFEGNDWYWIALRGGTLIEWFRRVE